MSNPTVEIDSVFLKTLAKWAASNMAHVEYVRKHVIGKRKHQMICEDSEVTDRADELYYEFTGRYLTDAD